MTVALGVLYSKKEKIYPAFVSKHKSNQEKQFFLMILNGGKREAKYEERRLWHYLAVIKISVLFRGITSKCDSNFYCLNWFHSFRT